MIVIAGASGFVGRALCARLPADAKIRALSRRPARGSTGRISHAACDLFNLLQTERALQGAKTAVYLVHSMSPSARLAQGDFADMDLICADNFARAAARAGVQRIVYLGGLIPKERPLSRHLHSRLEVEQTLASRQVPTTTLRAGLVVGPGGSSLQMMVRLVRRLPMMVVPRWCSSLTQPIGLSDAVDLLCHAIAAPPGQERSYDIGCDDVLTYAQMLQATSVLVRGRQVPLAVVPLRTTALSLAWVSWVTQTPMQLVMPLVESLRHDMVASDGRRLQKQAGQQPLSFVEAMRRALADEASSPAAPPPPPPARPTRGSRLPSRVLSVQRLSVPAGRDAAWIADEYAAWLPRLLRPLVRVQVHSGRVFRFYLPLMRRPLLVLSFAPERSGPGRQLFYITDGVLVRGQQPEPGRFEFRLVLQDRACLSAIHDFVPSLPWLVYKATQAILHGLIMAAFRRHLRRAPGQAQAS